MRFLDRLNDLEVFEIAQINVREATDKIYELSSEGLIDETKENAYYLLIRSAAYKESFPQKLRETQESLNIKIRQINQERLEERERLRQEEERLKQRVKRFIDDSIKNDYYQILHDVRVGMYINFNRDVVRNS